MTRHALKKAAKKSLILMIISRTEHFTSRLLWLLVPLVLPPSLLSLESSANSLVMSRNQHFTSWLSWALVPLVLPSSLSSCCFHGGLDVASSVISLSISRTKHFTSRLSWLLVRLVLPPSLSFHCLHCLLWPSALSQCCKTPGASIITVCIVLLKRHVTGKHLTAVGAVA